jgi:hypothetical protein
MSRSRVQEKVATEIAVTLRGLSGIMFDRFIDHSKEVRPANQKLYYNGDGKSIVIPAIMIESFITRQLAPVGCACKFEGKKGREYAGMAMSHVFFNPELIPIVETKTGKEIVPDDEIEKDGRFYVARYSTVTKMGGGGAIKQEAKPRPVLRCGWEISFEIQIIKNQLIDETKLYNWFTMGGIVIGIGSYRPRYGRFDVAKWEVIK